MELQDELNEEVVTPTPSRSFNYHLIYSILPFVIIIGSLFVGKLAVDYLSRDEAPKIETSITPSPEPSINYPTNTINTPTLQPSLRPTDPIINETQRRYTNGTAGISFLYPKDWSINHEVYTPKDEFELLLDNLSVTKNPVDHFNGNVIRKAEEKITVDNVEAKIIVSSECTNLNDTDGSTCQGIFGTIRIHVEKGEDNWFIEGFSFKKPEDLDSAVQRMRDLVSTVKFL